ncbi:hypothetical protein GOQ27_07080 [Clostridium sp. D2Q-11]|uniref:Distal tail protein N-terminal domain-containing protein n=1 Tax=Anaeromonas frigoriresistens TaxID=2683708 RepID=A0A942Z8T3_9FIRM|nr:hypothetical protein [Anaeromonas frigoriresistens]MBS4538220.1 hypothetical protein [Anaeromonas frigoriresistens]
MKSAYLINELNEKYNLRNFKDTTLIQRLNGLGYENELSYVRVGNYYKRDNKEIKQGELSGTLVFDDYLKYQNFIDYIERSQNLRIIYRPLDTEYYRDVDFKAITNVIKNRGTIECELVLCCKSLYYTEDNKRFVIEEMEGESRYSMPFPFQFNDYSSVAVAYNNTGHIEGEIIAEIYGYTQKPSIELYLRDKLKYKVVFDITIEKGQKLIYSARNGNNYVALEDEEGNQINIPNCLKLENDNFFKLPTGFSRLKITSDTGNINKIVFRIITAYKGV